MNIIDFIDSKTLRSHLEGKELSPAVECILISQSCNQPLLRKISALQERYNSFSESEFEKGMYNVRFENKTFRTVLGEYIDEKLKLYEEIFSVDSEYIFVIQPEFRDMVFAELNSALAVMKSDEERDDTTIRRLQINNPDYEIYICTNNDCGIYDIGDRKKDIYEEISDFYAYIPDEYSVGDIIKCGERYGVIANHEHYSELPHFMVHSDSTDMQLYCLEYSADNCHSCGGSFWHVHFPILQCELVTIDELPEKELSLVILSQVLKSELSVPDFLEIYTNGLTEYLQRLISKSNKEKKKDE